MQRPGQHQVVETLVRLDPYFRDRTSYPNTNEYRIEFGKTFKNVVGLALHDARLPITEDLVSSSRNTFTYVMNNASTTVAITPGKYTDTELIDAMNVELGGTLTLAIDTDTGRVTMTSATPFMIDIGHTGLSRILGFVQTSGFTPLGTSYSPEGPVDMSAGNRYIRIASNDIKTPGTGMSTDPGMGILFFDRANPMTDSVRRAYPVVYFDTIREKMSGMHIRIERDDGSLYDTKYQTHCLFVRVFTLNERLIQMR